MATKNLKKDLLEREINKIRQWEYKNLVYGKGYVDKWKGDSENLKSNMATRGYDAYRVSPRVAVIKGLKYRKVYGVTVSPNYDLVGRDKKSKKYYPKADWYHQGYIKYKKNQKVGTVPLRNLFNDFNKDELVRQLMLKKRRK